MPAMFAASDADRNRIAVTLTLVSGETLCGHVFPGISGKLKETMNQPERYLEFEKRDGATVYLLKDSIRAAEPFEVPRADQLSRKLRDSGSFDPWMTLGVDRSAGPAEIRTAYWARAKAYHPDKLVDKDAPREVVEFLNAMFARIHAAYKELSGGAEPV